MRPVGSKGINEARDFHAPVHSSLLASVLPFLPLSFHNLLPPIVVGILVIIVVIFIIKSLIKFAIIIGAIALIIFIAWSMGWLSF